MFDIKGGECPYCRANLTQTDDLIVCPECGTPHHRDCYKQHGCCANEHLHGTGFEWKRPLQEQDVIPDIPCPRCGRLNNAANRCCTYCGSLMQAQPAPQQPASLFGGIMPSQKEDSSEQGVQGMPVEISPVIDDIPSEEWRIFLGRNAPLYMFTFDRQAKSNSPLSFNIFAFFFPAMYFFFRKMWGIGLIAALANIVLSLPSLALQVFIPYGFNFLFGSASWQKMDIPAMILLMVVNAVWSLFSMYLYRRTARKRINSLKRSFSGSPEYAARLAREGGTSWVSVFLYVIAVMGACVVLAALLML